MGTGSSVVTIEELGPDGNTVLSAILLHGPGLPHQGAGWGTETAMTTTWNPGNGAAGTQQVTGPRELPSQWTGEWHRTQMGQAPSIYEDPYGNTQSIVDPFILSDALEDMVRRGRRLRVTWAVEDQGSFGPLSIGNTGTPISVSYSIVREGRCKRFKPSYHQGPTDITWEAEWEWASRGAAATGQRVTNTRSNGATAQSAAYAAAIQALIDANDAAQDYKYLPTGTTLGNLAALANLPTTLSTGIDRKMLQLQNNLAQIVNVAQVAESQPANIQQLAVNHARDSMAEANAVAQSLSQQGIETFSAKGDANSVLRAHSLFGPVQDSARLCARAAQAYYQQLRATLPYASGSLSGDFSRQMGPPPGSVQAVYITKQGDTLKKISQRYYQTPDHDVDVAKANRLSWMTPSFPPGTILTIPTLPTVVNPNTV